MRRLINEPTAAALAFGLVDHGDREPFLVFDLGGGTFDVSVVEKFEGIVEVRASAGDNRLGGDDFNEALAAAMLPRIDGGGRIAALPDVRREPLLLRAAEAARRTLSTADSAEFAVVLGEERLAASVTAAEFEAAAEPLLRRLRDPVVRAMRDCAIDAAGLSAIVLVGGATRMRVVRKAIARMFGRFPDASVHPDHAVALGAAIQAGLLARDAALDEVRITDVCPFTLGVDVSQRDSHGGKQSGIFSPIIDRNTPVPVSRSGLYQTASDNQKKLEFNIFQGEARKVSGNVKLGALIIPIPPRPAGEITAEVRFSYDSSGLLEVDVTLPETGQSRSLVIIDEEDRPSAADITRRRAALSALKFHPREGAENVALMARAERCYQDFLGGEREAIGHWITEFAGALDSQDPRRIADGKAELAGREASPTAGVIDSQSVKTTESVGISGYDAGKKVKGRKRHISTDTCGILVFILVRAADIIAAATAKGFVLLPRRWVVERTFAWLGRCRRLAKDWEKSIASSTAWATIASIRMLTRRIANLSTH